MVVAKENLNWGHFLPLFRFFVEMLLQIVFNLTPTIMDMVQSKFAVFNLCIAKQYLQRKLGYGFSEVSNLHAIVLYSVDALALRKGLRQEHTPGIQNTKSSHISHAGKACQHSWFDK